jgi:hypothetical protein
MKRQHFLSIVAAPAAWAALAGVTEMQAALAATDSSAMMAPITPAEQARFAAVAKAKGVKLTFEQAGAKAMNAPRSGRLDADTIDTSIAVAANRADKAGYSDIAAKLRRLASTGTSAQKTEFLMGSGKYYFPEDIQKSASVHATAVTCRDVCTFLCMCLTCQSPVDHCCQEVCRQVCRQICN